MQTRENDSIIITPSSLSFRGSKGDSFTARSIQEVLVSWDNAS